MPEMLNNYHDITTELEDLYIERAITIIKNLIISKICSMIYVPMTFIEDVDKLLFSFLWGKDKCPKIQRKTNEIAAGGLKLIDLKKHQISQGSMGSKTT